MISMIEKLLNTITHKEYEFLEKYREYYAWYDDPSSKCNTVPVREVLGEWARVKDDLYKMFSEQLTISKQFSYTKPNDELRSEMYDAVDQHSKLGRAGRNGWEFYKSYKNWIKETFPIHSSSRYRYYELEPQQIEEDRVNRPIYHNLHLLIDVDTLVNNEYKGETFTIILPDGKPYTIREGCKPMRALAKIAESFKIPKFEDFRICHSLVHNQKRIKGELTLSIHPLDYWTMSDNDCGWESCMNWRDCGGYRQGTVEMMNSPCVIVAYIAAKEPMHIDHNYEWNSKKWRQLFIVNKEVILGIKDYPYHNPELSDMIAQWIKELAEENLGWKYCTEKPEHFVQGVEVHNPKDIDKIGFKLVFCSNHMYTDVGALPYHPMYLGEELTAESSAVHKYSNGNKVWEFNYSGASQCVSCGELDPHLAEDSSLCCEKCEDIIRCCECGYALSRGEEYTIGEYHLCEECWQNCTTTCTACEETDFSDNMQPITLIPRLSEEQQDILCALWNQPKEEDKQLFLLSSDEGFWHELCYTCLANFSERYLKPGCEVFFVKTNYTWHKCCYIEDLTTYGRDMLLTGELAEYLHQGGKIDGATIEKYWCKYDCKIGTYQPNR